jgi:tetratricopeptide (TPR) repeat protein
MFLNSLINFHPRGIRTAGLMAALLWTAAASGEPPSERAVTLDQGLQGFKQEVLQLNHGLLSIEQALLYPDQSRTTLYVGVKVGGFLLEEISVRINENEPVAHTYTDSEARAFLKDGWHRLLRLRLEPGAYRLQAEFRGHFYDARPNDPPVRGRLETLIEKGLSELDFLLPIARNTRLDRPALSEISRLDSRKVRPHRNIWLPEPERYESALSADQLGGENDPRYRAALFLKNDGRFLSALTELLDIEQAAPDPAALPGEFQWLLAECYLGFGMEQQARQVYQRVKSTDPLVLANARLRLAEFEYQRGYFSEAMQTLQAVREHLPDSLRDPWRALVVNTLLAQNRYNEAIEVLTADGKLDDLPPTLRYNLAVALIKDGRETEGRRQLNLVGTIDVKDQDTLALRDKANLTLGYQYLQARQGKNAKAVFGRIRTQGPFSNRALLGLGWAELAPVAKVQLPQEAEGKNTDDSLGTLLRPGYVDPKARNRLNVQTRSDSAVSLAEQEAMLAALIPWVELSQRDGMDPAVQEGLLAIPWVLDRLEANEQSLKHYLDAIATLERARKRMDEAMKSIKGRRMVETLVLRDADSEKGWTWRVRDLPDAPETYFLQSLLAEHRFQESLKNYRDARLLTRNLDSWRERLASIERAGPVVESAGVQRQLERTRQNWQPPWAGTVMWLSFATELGSPGAYDAPLTDTPAAPLELQTLDPPGAFSGTIEQLRPLHERIAALRPMATEMGTAQNKLLETVSIKELEGQKKQIERYLTEARFAVARIYDRQRKGGR